MATLIGALVLGIWRASPEMIARLYGAYPAMTPNTAFAVLAAGLSLLLFRLGRHYRHRALRDAAVLAAFLTTTIGVLTALQYVFRLDLSIDALLVHSMPVGDSTVLRPSPRTALEFMLLGPGLMLSAHAAKKSSRLAEVLGLLSLLLPVLALVGYFYRVQPLYGISAQTGMAVSTAVGTLAAAIGLLCTLEDSLVLELLTGGMESGTLARKLLPPIFIVPVVLGWIQLRGEAEGLFESAEGLSVFAMALGLFFAALVFSTLRILDKAQLLRREAEAHFRAIADNASDSILSCDARNLVIYANASARQLFGAERLAVPGCTFESLFDDRSALAVTEKMASAAWALGATGQHFELNAVAHDGRRIQTEVSVGAWCVGAQSYSTFIVRDISERKRIENELRDRTLELERSNHELEVFAYTASHDLRAPVRNIDGISQLVIAEYANELGDKAREYLAMIRAATRTMMNLIDGLLTLSQVHRVEIKPEEVDLSELGAQVTRELQIADPHRNVFVDIEPRMLVQADRALMRSLVQNLLGNAWKYTAAKARAEITFGRNMIDAGWVYFVRDNGIGFESDKAGQMFAPFGRLQTGSDYKGAGIGLATVKRILDRHGGSIRAESTLGNGACFYFTLGAPAAA